MKTTGCRTGRPGGFFLRLVSGITLLFLTAAFCISAASESAKPHTTREPLVTQEPAPLPDTPARDAEGFLQEDGEFIHEDSEAGLWIYLSKTLQVEIRRQRDERIPLVWFETEIRTRGEERFRTVMTDPEHPGKKNRYPFDIARDEGLVLGFSDDFYAERMNKKETVGIIIREGEIISSKTAKKRTSHLPNLDMMIQYPDGRLEVCECTEYTAEELIEKGAVNVFSFGPILIRDGEIDEKMYGSHYRSIEPRHAPKGPCCSGWRK